MKILNAALLVSIGLLIGLVIPDESVKQLENKVEALEESNSQLQQDRDELYQEKQDLIDMNWNLKESLQKEQAE